MFNKIKKIDEIKMGCLEDRLLEKIIEQSSIIPVQEAPQNFRDFFKKGNYAFSYRYVNYAFVSIQTVSPVPC